MHHNTFDSSSETPGAALVVQLVRHLGEDDQCLSVLKTVTGCFSGDARHFELSRQIETNTHGVDIARWLDSLRQGWPSTVAERVQAALPFDRHKALALREHLESQPDTVRGSVGAYIRLANRFKLLGPLNGNQVRGYARNGWCDQGLRAHPLPFVADCPACREPVQCQLVFHRDGELQAWDLKCDRCGYYEAFDHSVAWQRGQASRVPTHSQLHGQFRDILARQSPQWLAGVAPGMLRVLHEWLAELPQLLQDAANAATEGLRHLDDAESVSSDRRGWHIRLFTDASFELRSNVQLGYVGDAVCRESSPGFHVFRALDEPLEEHPERLFKRSFKDVSDVAVHWRARLDALCQGLADALALEDIALGAAHAVHLVYEMCRHGLVTPVVFDVLQPDANLLQLARQHALKGQGWQARRANEPAVAVKQRTLAQFLAEHLHDHGVDAPMLERLLAQYRASPRALDDPNE